VSRDDKPNLAISILKQPISTRYRRTHKGSRAAEAWREASWWQGDEWKEIQQLLTADRHPSAQHPPGNATPSQIATQLNSAPLSSVRETDRQTVQERLFLGRRHKLNSRPLCRTSYFSSLMLQSAILSYRIQLPKQYVRNGVC